MPGNDNPIAPSGVVWGRRVALALLAFAASLAGAAAEDWPGWRGLAKQGRSPADGPLHWSPTQNVRWKTPIPGRGHSSPIVVGDRVLVTTAYFTGKGRALRRAVHYGALALALLLPLLALPVVVRCSRAGASLGARQFLALAFGCLALGLLVHLLAAAHLRLGGPADSTEQQMECWLFGGQFAALCLIVAALGAGRWRPAVAVLAIALGGLVVLGRPAPAYFALSGAGPFVRPLQVTAALPVGIAMVLLATWLTRRRGAAHETAEARGRLRLPRLVLAAGALVFGLAAMGVPQAVAALRHFQGRLEPGVPYRWSLLIVGFSTMIAACACVGLWAAVEFIALRRPLVPLPRTVAVGALVLGALVFAEKGCLDTRREFVRAIVCLDRATGEVRWTREALRGPQPSTNALNSPATPTPATDGQRVVAWFGSAGCLCTDLDGRVLWVNRGVPFNGVHGVGASPVVAGGRVLIVSAQAKAPYVAALDIQTGQRLWTTKLAPWPGAEGQHRTPTVATVGGKPALLVWAWERERKGGRLRVLDVASGEPIAAHPVQTHGEQVASVVAEGGVVYLANTREATALSLAKLASGEPPVLWTAKLKGKGPYAASPVFCDGMLFMVSPRGHATCLDAGTGTRLWQRRLPGGDYMASLVSAGRRLYCSNAAGRTIVLACERISRKLAENDLAEALVATPAPVDGRLLVRTASHLWCIGQ
ncbi:PQQ-binding-like beta-propeller repeat protein [bacterium]|nr:PQQ-binding-like beta-propeller repeat protein [bacterium]